MIDRIQKPGFKMADEEMNTTKGTLTVTPLVKSMGITLGNSLRRVMIENIPGAAVHAVKINGAAHEFATIKGVKEDAAQIILNLKKLAIKVTEAADKDITLEIKSNTVGEVMGGDIKCPAGVEIMNKNLVVATLDKGAKVEIEAKVSVKTGYRTWKDNKGIEKSTGFISTDSNYCPIIKANYRVQPAKSKEDLGTEELIFEIETNGALTANEAISWAANILNDHLSMFADLEESIKNTPILTDLNAADQEEIVYYSIEHLDLSVRPYNCLKNAGITTLSELVSKTKKEIKAIKNLGNTSFVEVIGKLEEMGYKLK